MHRKGRHSGHLTPAEWQVAYDLVAIGADYDQVAKALKASTLTNRRVFHLAQTMIRERYRAWPDVDADRVADDIGYDIGVSYVRTAFDQYLVWDRRHNEARHRLRGIIDQLWVPDAESLPFQPLFDVDGVNERQVGGRTFTWVQHRFQVRLSWVDEDTNVWLLEESFPYLNPESPRRFGEEWRELQRRMCHYLNETREYFWSFDTGSGDVTLADVENSIMNGGGLYGGQIHPRVYPRDDVRRAYMLLKEPAHLGFSVTQFRNRLIAHAGL